MRECSKSVARRLADSNFIRRYFVGKGVDIGGKPDPLMLHAHLFDRMTEVRVWDLEDGDAQYMEGVPDEHFDFVHSSHCLEHLVDPAIGLKNWLRVTRPGGHVVVTVPDEDLYEQGVFPSTFNRDHKWTFAVCKHASWSPRSLNVVDLVRELGPTAELVRLEQLSTGYRFDIPRYDQSMSPVAEFSIEFVLRKREPQEIADRGRWRRPAAQPDASLRRYLNQYRDDRQALKDANRTRPPFRNEDPL
jgi:SAM-dependent methyltransferase